MKRILEFMLKTSSFSLELDAVYRKIAHGLIALCAPPLVFTTKITKESASMPMRSRLIRPESALAPACSREGNHPSSQEGADRQNEGVYLENDAKFCKEPITASGEVCT